MINPSITLRITDDFGMRSNEPVLRVELHDLGIFGRTLIADGIIPIADIEDAIKRLHKLRGATMD